MIPQDIIKIQKKLCSFKKGSRNYIKYTKILAKHTKQYNMKKRVQSNIKTIESIEEIKKISEKQTLNKESSKLS